MKFAFTKMHGAANDFVVIDHREPFVPVGEAGVALLAALCDRRRGIGADGVLMLERHDTLDFTMRYVNADGRAADFCGNGARCLARFALDLGLGRGGEVAFASDAGPKRARLLADGRIELAMGAVGRPEPVRVEAAGRAFDGRFVLAGVPHFVAGVPDLAAVPLAAWAPALRAHTRFGAPGANVDFVQVLGPSRVAMRTWERGVEGETLACGSGSVACAAWALAEGHGSPITVRTAGGDDLVVDLSPGGEAVLTGPVERVFEGTWRSSSHREP